MLFKCILSILLVISSVQPTTDCHWEEGGRGGGKIQHRNVFGGAELDGVLRLRANYNVYLWRAAYEQSRTRMYVYVPLSMYR